MTIEGVSPDNMIAGDLTEFMRETAPELLLPEEAAIRRSRCIGIVAVAVATAVIALVVSARAFADPSGTAPAAKAHHACAVVLGLDPSQAPYQDCIASLSRNLPKPEPPVLASVERVPDTTLAKARLACADAGLEPGSVGFTSCVTDVDRSLSTQLQLNP